MRMCHCQQPATAVLFFFFSSRRRHTRCSRDWSSDVCSSDLGHGDLAPVELHAFPVGKLMQGRQDLLGEFQGLVQDLVKVFPAQAGERLHLAQVLDAQMLIKDKANILLVDRVMIRHLVHSWLEMTT